MIIETTLENGLIERKSNKGVNIKNEVTGAEYAVAVDLPNAERTARGFEAYTYVETNRAISDEDYDLQAGELLS